MKHAKWVFRIVGLLGILEIAPLFFLEAQVDPPAMNHPEYYYGFAGVTLTWQLVFLVISTDPQRYRLLMPIAVLEKVGFWLPCLWLYSQGRLPDTLVFFALLDFVYGLFFVSAYFVTRPTGLAPRATRQ